MPAFSLDKPAAKVVGVTTAALVLTLSALAVRIVIRWKVNVPLKADDAACIAATVTAEHPSSPFAIQR